MQLTDTQNGSQLVVITGGPCSGKTTLLAFLADQGFITVPEAALTIIERLNALTGVARQQRWRLGHPLEFQYQVLELQIQRENAARGRSPATVFVDRGRLDGLAYLQMAGQAPPAEYLERCLRPRYHAVFLLSTLTRFQARHDTGRTESAEGSRRIGAQLRQVYDENGYGVIEVPQLPVDQRARLVLNQLALRARPV